MFFLLFDSFPCQIDQNLKTMIVATLPTRPSPPTDGRATPSSQKAAKGATESVGQTQLRLAMIMAL